MHIEETYVWSDTSTSWLALKLGSGLGKFGCELTPEFFLEGCESQLVTQIRRFSLTSPIQSLLSICFVFLDELSCKDPQKVGDPNDNMKSIFSVHDVWEGG